GASDEVHNLSGVGLATLPCDRFAGIAPTERTGQGALSSMPAKHVGQVTMKPIDLSSYGAMTLNADASAGAIRVEVLDEEGKLMRDLTREDAVPVKGDALRHEVKWNGKKLSDLPAGRYMLRLHLDRATV